MSRPWSQADGGRGADLHVSLDEDGRYAAQHASISASASWPSRSACSRMLSTTSSTASTKRAAEAVRASVYVEAREYHVQRLARILLDGALREWAARRPK